MIRIPEQPYPSPAHSIPEPPKYGEIPRLVDDLFCLIDSLEKEVTEIKNKIDPILSSPSIEECKVKEGLASSSAYLTPLGRRLESLAYRIEMTRNIALDILRNIEV
jgi:hypothetical protein